MSAMGKENPLKPEMMMELTIPVSFGRGDSDKMVTDTETDTFFKAAGKNGEKFQLTSTPHPIEKADPWNLASIIITTFDE